MEHWEKIGKKNLKIYVIVLLKWEKERFVEEMKKTGNEID